MLQKIKNFGLLLTFIICTAETCTKEKEPTPVPTANFTYNFGKNGEVKFTNTSENALSYSWDFGDGQNSIEQNPVHIYTDEKAYTVKLTVESKDKQKKDLQQTVSVENFDPVASFTYDILSNGKVKFNNLSKYASVFEWTIEGQKQKNAAVTFEYEFRKNGKHTVSLNIEKKNGLKANISKELTIKDIPTAADSTAGKYIGEFSIQSGTSIKVYKNFEINFDKLSDSTIVIKKITVPEFSDENVVFQIKGSSLSRLGPSFCEGYLSKAENFISFCVIYTPIWVGFKGNKVQ